MIKVFGHLNPDTDSTVSALVYAWYLNEHRSTEATAYLLGKPNKEALYLLNHFQQEEPQILESIEEDDLLTIVDTNNPKELLEDVNKVKILEIVDHHKLFGGLSTTDPLTFTIRPFGCTATVIWSIMQNEGVNTVPAKIAGLMLGAILSDTLKFTSPTTTKYDKEAAKQLAQICGEDIEELSTKMFEAKSDLTGMSARDILTSDSKVFEFNGQKFRISSLETTSPKPALQMAEELKKEMELMKQEEGNHQAMLYVIDILNSCAYPVVPSYVEQSTVEKAFGVKLGDNTVLEGVVSRKKQIAPAIESAVN